MRNFYLKLALKNINSNKRIYYPYILTCVISCMMFYMIAALALSDSLAYIRGGTYLAFMLGLGIVVTGLFIFLFITYSNNFLTKRRKKEFGLYNILGLDKKHLAIVVFLENTIVYIITIVFGCILGITFAKLLQLLLLRMVGINGDIMFGLSTTAILICILFFLFVSIVTLLISIKAIVISNPIELLKGGNVGEKEPKVKYFSLIVGIVTLVVGYVIAQLINNPIEALLIFFIAVTLVIIGTYCLFSAISIAILKALKSNKKIYYNAKNFTTISGMLYRMRQNAKGLANICILSTFVLVTLSTTITLYAGMESITTRMYPEDVVAFKRGAVTENVDADLQQMSNLVSGYEGVESVNILHCSRVEYYYKDNKLNNNVSIITSSYVSVVSIPVEDYNRLMNTNYELSDDEILLFSPDYKIDLPTIEIGNKTYSIKEQVEINNDIASINANNVYASMYVITSDDQIALQIIHDSGYYTEVTQLDGYMFIGTNGNEELASAVADNLYQQDYVSQASSRNDGTSELKAFYGSFLFVGIFLSVLFIIGATLIIYYKQISEGYDDCERYQIMQKVGMSQSEVKKTINKQIMVVFFLPIIIAIIHLCGAHHMIAKLLELFMIKDGATFIICSIVCVIIYGVIYGVVYKITSNSYYRIVKFN